MKPSFRSRLTLLMVLVLTGTMLIVGTFTYVRAFRTVDQLVGRILRQTSGLIDQRIGAFLGSAETQSRLLAGLISPRLQAGAGTTADDFPRITSDMVEMMRISPDFGTVSFTLEQTGETIYVQRPPTGSLIVGTLTRGRDGRLTSAESSLFGDSLQPRDVPETSQVDPRGSEAYRRAKSAREQAWTEVYVVQDGPVAGSPGVTCATPVFDRRGALIGVVRVELSIADLSRFLQTIRIGTSGYAFLAEFPSSGRPRIIAHPEPNRLLITEGGRQSLADAESLGDRALAAFMSRIEGLEPSPAEGIQRHSIEAESTRYIGAIMPVTGAGRPNWALGILAPSSDYTGGIRQTAYFLIVFGLVMLDIAVVASVYLANRVTRPLRELAAETERITALDLEPRPPVGASVAEVDALAKSIEQMKGVLRSFEKLVPTEYARWLIASGQEAKLGGERKHITIYFADIVGFTTLSERMDPESLMPVLTKYLDILSGEVLALGGTIDKFNGDDVMAFWGAPSEAPQQALMACKAALNTQAALDALAPEWEKLGLPALPAACGIATGDVVVGNVGSGQRMNYTVIGDAVNLASRLQGLNKHYGTRLLISERTFEEAGPEIVARLVDWVSVVGKEHPVKVYELLALRSLADEETIHLAETHNAALSRYRAQDWQAAIRGLEQVLSWRPHDGPAHALLTRARAYRVHPPGPDWDGAQHMVIK